MKIIANRKWTVADRGLAETIRSWLVEQGGENQPVTGAHELWRVQQSGAKWTYYTTGTLYVTDSDDAALLGAQRHIDRLVGGRFVGPTRDFLIGLDETGKGELFGPVVLAAVVLPRPLFGELEEIIGVADTKVRHGARYWEELFGRIDFYRSQGLHWALEEILPEEFDRCSVNRLLDRTYRKLLDRSTAKLECETVRIVLDDYGVGADLRRSLDELRSNGAEIVRQTRADDRYLECRLASLVAKRRQQQALETIRGDRRFRIDGHELGSGNAGDPKTLAWLRAWHAGGRPWPAFVKRSFRTIREIEGLPKMGKRPSPG